MVAKYTFDYVKNFVAENGEGDSLVSDIYINSKEELIIKCHLCGEEYSTNFDYYRSGKRHWACMAKRNGLKKRKSIKDIREYAKKNGCELKSNTYTTEKDENLEFVCRCGNVFITSWANFREAPQCNSCGVEIRATQRRKDIEEVRRISSSIGLCLLDSEYKNNSKKMVFVDKDGYRYCIPYSYVKTASTRTQNGKKSKPEIVGKSNPYSIENIKAWLKNNNLQYSLVAEEFAGNQEPLEFLCHICNNKFPSNWNRVYTTHQRCPYCIGQKVWAGNCLGNKYPLLVEEWDYEKNYPLTPFSVTAGSNRKVGWICSECGRHWDAAPNERTQYRRLTEGYVTRCKLCATPSKGEERCNEYFLGRIEIPIVKRQHSFWDCRDTLPLPFDFYLPEYNLCIEYNGKQHYEPVERFGGVTAFLVTQKHDQIKKEYCFSNGINFLVIPYWEYKDISSILQSELIKILQRKEVGTIWEEEKLLQTMMTDPIC